MPSREDLAQVYGDLSDEGLKELGRSFETLTDDAKATLTAEFARRHLEMPEIERPATTEYQDVVTIRRFRDPTEAMVAKSVLDSAGIECYLRDENTVRLDWGISNLIGGIRLQVPANLVQEAEKVVSEPVPSSISWESGDEFDHPRCPRCGSMDVGFEGLNRKVGLASMFLLNLPIAVAKNAWKCGRCGVEWKDDSDSG